MAHLATCLRYHVAAKQNSDPLWKDVSIYTLESVHDTHGIHDSSR